MTRFLLALCLFAVASPAQDVRGIIPSDGQKPTGPYTPGVMAGDYLYVASQGPRRADGTIPATIAEQVDQSVANVEAIVRAAELTRDHIAYTHVYLDDMSLYDDMNRAYAKHFTTNPPARAVVGVYKRDNGMHITINAVAVRDLSMKKAVAIPGVSIDEPYSPGILTHDRLFVSGMLGRDLKTGKIPEGIDKQVALALDNVGVVLKAAGLDHSHMVFVNPYVGPNIAYGEMNKVYASYFEFGNTPARATIFVTSLPHKARIEFTGVAVRDLSKRLAVRPKNMKPSPTASPCVFAADTFYCSAKSGFIPGINGGIFAATVQNQLRQTMRNLLDNLEEAGLDFSNVVATNLYFDDRSDYDAVNEVYKLYFPDLPPARTAVQQLTPTERRPRSNGRWPTLEQISLIAVKP
jgi:enamine deaminase RidA (YjgF/YER057c/UK114 family)